MKSRKLKTHLKTTAAVITLIAVFVAPAVSAAVSQSELRNKVNSALGTSAGVTVHERNGVVTLTGQYENAADKFAAIRAAGKVEGVKRVINLGFTSKN